MRKTAADQHILRGGRERDLRFWNRFFGGLLVLGLIPLAILSFYNHASADDFAFANYPHHGWMEGGLFGLLQGIGRQMHWSYTSWQGCYTAVLLGTLNPAALGDSWYALVTYLLVGFLILSNWIFWRELLKDRGTGHGACGSIAAWILSLAMIQLIPRALDMFFWWDGAVNYLPFFGMLLILAALLMRNLRQDGLTARQETAAILLAFAAMGGNYVTALVNLLVLAGFGMVPFLLRTREGRSRGRRRRCYAGILLCGCAGLAVSVLAPGNLLRMDQEGADGITSIPAMVIHSVYLAYESVGESMSILLVLLLLLAAPFLWCSFAPKGGEMAAGDGAGDSGTERLLGLPTVPVTAALFGLYAASYAPSVYVYGDGGPMRIEDVRFFYLVTLLALLEWFLLGKIRRYWERHAGAKRSGGVRSEGAAAPAGSCLPSDAVRGGTREDLPAWTRPFLSSVLVLTACFVLFCYVLPRENRERLTSLCAARSLLIGEAQQYDAQMQERLAILEDPALDGEDVTVPAFTVRPYLLFLYGLELTEDPSYWINETVAEYYDKGSVTLVESAEE